MAQPAPKLRLVEAPSTGYARKAWISHVIETAPEEVGGVELAVLKELADLIDDATGWAEASYPKLAYRTRLSERTVRRAVKLLAASGLVEPELIGGRAGEGRARIRYRFPAMHAWLAERKARRAVGCADIPPGDRALPDGGQRDHGQGDHGHKPRPTLVTQSQNPPPLKEPIQEPSAHAREGLDLDQVLKRLGGRLPAALAEAVRASAPELHGRMLALWMPAPLESLLRGQEGRLQAILAPDGMGLRLERANRKPNTGCFLPRARTASVPRGHLVQHSPPA
jgi:hypothetical protein